MLNIEPERLKLQCRGGAGIDNVVPVLRGSIVTYDVVILTDDSHIDGVGEVGVEGIWKFAVGEHFFDLVDSWIGMMGVDEDGL